MIVETTNDLNLDDLDLDDIDVDDDDDETVHTKQEHPLVNIPIVECPVNYEKNQIIISQVNIQPFEFKIVKLFDNKLRIFVQFSTSNYENKMTKFTRDFVVPNIIYILKMTCTKNLVEFCNPTLRTPKLI